MCRQSLSCYRTDAAILCKLTEIVKGDNAKEPQKLENERWTEAQDCIVLDTVKLHLENETAVPWSTNATKTGRSIQSCKARFYNHLNP